MSYKITTVPWHEPTKQTKSRVYVDLEKMSGLKQPPWTRDHLGNIDFTGVSEWRARAIAAAKVEVHVALEAAGVHLTTADIKWSDKAGCSCGCSPAFILAKTVDLGRNDLTIEKEGWSRV